MILNGCELLLIFFPGSLALFLICLINRSGTSD